MQNFLSRLRAELIPRIIGVAVMGVIVVVLAAIGKFNRDTNYTVTQGVVTAAVTDCYLEDSTGKLTEKGSSDLAYMPCDIAPIAAAEFKMSTSAIKKRSKVTFSYVSPVDKQQHIGKHDDAPAYNTYNVGQTYAILAHKTKADKTMWGDRDQQQALAAKQGTATATDTATATVPTAASKPTATASVNGLRGKL